jgi:nucleotide-binding universal stress UspA family protein
MKKKILIPTDFSKNAWNAITYAADLFKDQECSFYLLNSYSSTRHSRADLMAVDPRELSFQNEKIKSQDGLDKISEMLDLREQNINHTYTVLSVLDDPLNAIKEAVEKLDIGLIVMGTKGVSNYDHRLFGTHTITIMEKMRNCPTLGIPMGASAVGLKEIVFPTSFRTHYKHRELIHLVDLAKSQNANICVLHVTESEKLEEEQQYNKTLLADCLEGTSFSFHLMGGADPAAGIKSFVESRNSDMVAFINSKHSFITNLLTTPLVKELGMFSKVPLLVMHDLRN